MIPVKCLLAIAPDGCGRAAQLIGRGCDQSVRQFHTEMKRRGYEVQETTPPEARRIMAIDCGGHPVRKMES